VRSSRARRFCELGALALDGGNKAMASDRRRRCHDCCADAIKGRSRCEACLDKQRRVRRDASFAADVRNVLHGSRRMVVAARNAQRVHGRFHSGWHGVETTAKANAETAVNLKRALEAARGTPVRTLDTLAPATPAHRCVDCRAIRNIGKKRCERCLRKNREQAVRRRARYRRESACACGRPRDRADRSQCDRCLERERRRDARRRAKVKAKVATVPAPEPAPRRFSYGRWRDELELELERARVRTPPGALDE